MKKQLSHLSNLIKAAIQAHAPQSSIKVFEHLACDGAVCDPKHHRILFEDDTIRVVDVILDAQSDEIFHRHERCAIMYVDRPASIEYYGNIDKPNDISWSSSNLERRSNIIPFEEMHKVKNVDSRQFRAFRIELSADILKLQNHDVLLEQIHELVKFQIKSLDLIRQTILRNESKAPVRQLSLPKTDKHDDKKTGTEPKPFLNHYPLKKNPPTKRKSEAEELCEEAKIFLSRR